MGRGVAGQDHIQRKIGADVRARVVHAAKQFQRAHHVVRVALHKGLAHAFGHGIIEVHDALPAVLIVLVGLDGDAGERGIAVDVPRFAQIALSCGETVFEQAEQIDLAAGRGEGEEIHIVDVDIAIAVRLGVFGLDHAQKVELFRAFGAVLQHGAHGGIAIDIGVFALEVGIFGGTESNILINLHQPSVDFAHAAALGAIENIAFGGAHKAVFNEDFFNRVLHLFNCGHFDGFAFSSSATTWSASLSAVFSDLALPLAWKAFRMAWVILSSSKGNSRPSRLIIVSIMLTSRQKAGWAPAFL